MYINFDLMTENILTSLCFRHIFYNFPELIIVQLIRNQ